MFGRAFKRFPICRMPGIRRSCFDAQVVAVREDIAKYADIISAVKFQPTTRKESCALEGNAGGIAKVNVYALKRALGTAPICRELYMLARA